jgi:hypothetical protein
MRSPPIRSITLLIGLLSACAATPALAQTKDQTHQAAELASVDSAKVAAEAAATLDSATGVAVTKFCGTKTSASYGYMRTVCPNPAKAGERRAAVKRTLARADSIERAFAVLFVPPAPTPAPTPEPGPTPSPAPAPTPGPPKDSTIVVAPPPSPPVVDGTPPGPVIFRQALAPPANGAKLAQLPLDTVDVSPPAVVRVIRTSNPQAALDTARTGDQIRVAPGVYRNVIARANPRWTGWVDLRTDLAADSLLGGPWERMTDSKSLALKLATFTTFSTDPALLVSSGAHHLRVTGIRMTSQFSGLNAVVVVGQGENDTTRIPHFITFDRDVVNCGNSNHTRRGVRFDAIEEAFVSGSIVACRDSAGGDSQGMLVINTAGPGRIENNTIQGGHQSLFFGGGSPLAPGILPRDFVIRRNDFCRPTPWLTGGNDGDQIGKALVEWKMGERHLFEGNVVCHMDASGQYGYAFNVKAEDQDGLAPWTTTRDITFRYNKLSCVVAGWSLAGAQGWAKVQPAQRITIYDNVATDSIATAPCAGPYDALTLISISDVVFARNHIRNVGGRAAIYFMGQNPNLAAINNTLGGEYGLKGDGVDWPALAPNALITGNTLLGNQPLSAYPAVAIDSTRNALLRGVVVAP